MLSQQDADILKLLERSPDRGDGWRSVSKLCWRLIDTFDAKELLEIDKDNFRVRLSERGAVVVDYI